MASEAGAADMNRRRFLQRSGAMVAAAGLAGAQAANETGGKPLLRVAVLSKWHPHAGGYGKSLKDMPDVKITTVWDEKPDRGKEWAKELGAPFEPDLAAVLKRPDVDAVMVTAPTNRHPEIMIAAANAKKHIFTEKVMAITVDECRRIADAVRAANVKFCISFPHRTRPDTLYAYKAVKDGLLGELTFARARVAHDAASANWLPQDFYDPVQCGGGAMMDLGAHPMYLLRWIGGQPVSITSMFTAMTDHPVEDNAVSTIEFKNKAIGVSETSFVSGACPFSLELVGTEGTMFLGGPTDPEVRFKTKKMQSKEFKVVPATDLPPAMPKPIQMWVDGILRGTPIPFGPEEGTQLTELMQYAYQSSREGKRVAIPPREPVASS